MGSCPWLCPYLSPPGDRWCDVLGFVPASLLQVIDGVMSLALCLQVVSQASQRLNCSKMLISNVESSVSEVS